MSQMVRVFRRPGVTQVSIDCFEDTTLQKYATNYDRIFGQNRELDANPAAPNTAEPPK